MRTRILGKTDLKVSEVGLGTYGLSGEGYGSTSEREVDWCIDRARELDINLYETSASYSSPGGEPFEARIGSVLNGDKDCVFVTRIGNDIEASPPRKNFRADYLQQMVERSAERFKRAPDVVLLHHPITQTVEKGEATEALQALKNKGLLKYWGVACQEAATARTALRLGASVIEMPYNILCAREVHSIAGELQSSRAGFLARSPLAYGLLCGVWAPDKTFATNDHRSNRWTHNEFRARLKHVTALRSLVHGNIHTIRAAALRFVLANANVGSCVVGVKNSSQLESNLRAIGDDLPYIPSEDLEKIPMVLREAGSED